MNTEKIEKLKKGLTNSQIPENLKQKIREQIQRLEAEDKQSQKVEEEIKEEIKEQSKPVAKTTSTRKPRTKKSVAKKPVAKKTSTRKPSQTTAPKRTAMSLAKEIRKEGESWNEARARASKMMKEKTHTATKDVESELDKLIKLVQSDKYNGKLKGFSDSDLKRDAVRKAKPLGARKVTRSGETSNQYGTYKNHLGRKYYESRDKHGDRLAPKYPKNAPFLAEGGYLTDPNFGNFQNTMFADGGELSGVNLNFDFETEGDAEFEYPQEVKKIKLLRERINFDEVRGSIDYGKTKDNTNLKFYKNGKLVMTLKGDYDIDSEILDTDIEILGSKHKINYHPYDSMGGVNYLALKNELENTVFANGGFMDGVYAKGGGIRRKNGQTYDFGSAWTNDHNQFDKGADHEVNYRRKRFELGGVMTTDLAGHTGGGTGGLNTGMPLDGFSNTAYTGLVGETGAMSSGEMFMNGGGLKNLAIEDLPNDSSSKQVKYWASYIVTTETEDNEKINSLASIMDDLKLYSNVFFEDGFACLGFNFKGTKQQLKDNLVELATAMKKMNVRGKLDLLNETSKEVYDNLSSGEMFANGGGLPNGAEQSYVNYYLGEGSAQGIYAKGGGVRRKNGQTYDFGSAWTNDHNQFDKGADHEVDYRKKKSLFNKGGVMATGGGVDSPSIYVADLEAYNNGVLQGEWLDLSNYSDAGELMEAIQELLDNWGVEEYAIHDAENIPSGMYSEYMGESDFEELYEMMELANDNDLPLPVVQDVVNAYGTSAVSDFMGKYDSADEFARQLVDDMGGIENFNNFEQYLSISSTDRRLLAQEMADNYVQDIEYEDGGNRLIEEAGLDVEEYEEADSDRQEEMLEEAKEIVYDKYYDQTFDELADPYSYFVEEQGLYSVEDFANANFVNIDYEDLGDDLEQDYAYIYYDSELYVFNVR